jgi:hypothetical protein
MPYAFPAAAPTLSGDLLTISRFLQDPARISRRLRDYTDLRFVSDQLLKDRQRASGGAVLYDMTEPFISDRTVEAVSAGSEYPYANLGTGTAGIAAVSKWGQKAFLSDEEVTRKSYPMSAVDRAMTKIITTVIKQVDTISMAAIGTAITAEVATVGSWDNATASSRKPLDDILLGIQAIEDLNLGYHADTLVVSPKAYTYLMLNDAIAQLRKRETSDNPVYTGMIETVANLTVVKTPNLPVVTRAWILDSTQLGGMADEAASAPGYAAAAREVGGFAGVEVKAIRKEGQDGWDLQARRLTVPFVQETGAGYEITGVVS